MTTNGRLVVSKIASIACCHLPVMNIHLTRRQIVYALGKKRKMGFAFNGLEVKRDWFGAAFRFRVVGYLSVAVGHGGFTVTRRAKFVQL
jgi:hypothetical protein